MKLSTTHVLHSLQKPRKDRAQKQEVSTVQTSLEGNLWAPCPQIGQTEMFAEKLSSQPAAEERFTTPGKSPFNREQNLLC